MYERPRRRGETNVNGGRGTYLGRKPLLVARAGPSGSCGYFKSQTRRGPRRCERRTRRYPWSNVGLKIAAARRFCGPWVALLFEHFVVAEAARLGEA